MAGQLLPLRLLGAPRVPRVGAFSVLTRAFPFRLKYLVLFSDAATAPGARAFSGRAARPGRPRGDFRARGVAGHGRSLIDDEAELSDWVSELKTDSLRLGLSSDDERDSERGMSRNRGDRERDSLRSYGNKASLKRGRESELDARRSRFGSRNRFGSDFGDEDDDNSDDEDGGFGSRKRREPGGRSGSSSSLARREPGGRSGSSSSLARREPGGRSGSSSSLARRGWRGTESSYRQERGAKKQPVKLLDEEDDDDEVDDMTSDLEDDFFGDKEERTEGVEKNAVGMASPTELGGGASGPTVSRSSGGQSDSYLSQTR